ncbi:hypothetical protein BGZ74_001344 [Mortierella antarctica]|nr:hypothetical protein BGZ74_001344 [Mortierella antarctica]
MKSFISVVVASTLLASTAFASLKSCGSRTNDFIYKSADYSPYPADPSTRICFNLRGKVQQAIPSGSKATISFSFGETLEPKINVDIAKENNSFLQSCFFFPMEFQYMKNSDISVRLEVEHPAAGGGSKRVLCVQGVVKT